ncbi:MAG: Crp/Fnr family transcriptional regulator [Alphaproteobacteria bacterium]|nr:MAG: Crp/Fnr family transcriptional regulator [Alphaproteobacteria bacterium]
MTPHSRIIRQLETVSRLDDIDRRALWDLPLRLRSIESGRDIFREGQATTECCVLLSGVACRYKMVAGGRRQILSFHFAGDIPDLQTLTLNRTDHSLAVLTRSAVAFIPHAAIRALSEQRPAVGAAFLRQALVDGAIFREWITNVGRRMAFERVAHLICECFERMRAMGLADDSTFEFPVTQSELGDATGLSNVHVNRTMQALRKSGLVVSKGKVHTIPDWSRLREAADFNPAYLHLLPALEHSHAAGIPGR